MRKIKAKIFSLIITIAFCVSTALASSPGLLYTNLVDKDVQDEVKGILTEADMDADYVENVFAWIDEYNAGIGDIYQIQ